MAGRSGAKATKTYDHAYVKELIERIVRECPDRRPTSPDELKSQMMMKDEFEQLGLATEVHPFLFNENLYANVALHFGLASLGTLVSPTMPLAAFVLHLGSAASYWADSTRKAYVLRRLFPFKPSRNILAVLPAEGKPRLRVVLLAHADAAFTGRIFEPESIEFFSEKLPKSLHFIKRSFALAIRAQVALAGIDALRMVFGPLTLPLRPLEHLLTVPSLLTFLGSLDVVLKNLIVPARATTCPAWPLCPCWRIAWAPARDPMWSSCLP